MGESGEGGDSDKDGDCGSGEDHFGIMLLHTVTICHFIGLIKY